MAIYYNENGAGTAWVRQVIADTGLHNGVVADIGNDSDYDIFGANFTGNPPLRLWVNQSNRLLDQWHYIQVDGQRERYSKKVSYFGLAANFRGVVSSRTPPAIS